MSHHSRSAQGTLPNRKNRRELGVFMAAGLVIGLGNAMVSAQNAPQANQGQGVAGAKNTASFKGTDNLAQGKSLMLKLDGVPTQYTVSKPDAKQSPAVRVVNPALPHMDIEMQLFARVAVGARDEATIKRAIAQAGAVLGTGGVASHTYRKFLDMDNVYVVNAVSVEDAINLAAELESIDGVEWAEIDYQRQVKSTSTVETSRGGSFVPNDPFAPFQWHVFNFATPNHDHNVHDAYAMGITGQGVTVGILEAFQNSFFRVDDTGVLEIHPDLLNKTNFTLSIPTDPYNVSYSHGVSVAGIVGAEANNSMFSAGLAYGSQLVSLRNGNSIDAGESFGHALNSIDIINNSWGAITESFPGSNTGKYVVREPDDFEIDIPQVSHAGISRIEQIGLDQGIRMGRGRKGRVFVFSAGNANHFQGFARLGVGNAISLPGFGPDPAVDSYGYLDITGFDPRDLDGDGIPESFLQDGTLGMGWRWSGLLGERVEYKQMASLTRTLAIAAVGENNVLAGYSTTGTSIFASGYSEGASLDQEFDPDQGTWSGSAVGRGIVTLEQPSGMTLSFNGTSAAAPVVSGIIALMLEANPSLTIRDIQHIIQQTAIPLNYDATQSYWPSIYLGLGRTDPDGNPPSPTFWTTNSAGIRHSDEYGFGLVDAGAAVALASDWTNVSRLIQLDSGMVNATDNPTIEDATIEDATFRPVRVVSDNLETNVLDPGTRLILTIACIRNNIKIEGVELTLTIEGDGAGDLLIALESPRHTVSPLALPRGDSNGLNGFAYANYTFSTYKHWGELSGGNWNLILQDFRPDEESPEGDLPADPPDPEDLGLEQVTYLGTFGLPGNADHTEKTLVSYQLKIFGTEIGAPVYEGCQPGLTSCPGDLDGSGVIDVDDLLLYIEWYTNFDPRADMDGDGDVDFLDLFIYRSFWIPGPCGRNPPYLDGRPSPSNGDPIIRPI